VGVARAFALLLAFVGGVHAKAVHAVKDGPIGTTGVRFDKAHDRYETTVAVAADLRAPSAQIARVRAESHAGVVAVDRFLLALKDVHHAAARDVVEGAVKKPSATDVLYGSDGSVTMTFALPIADLNATHDTPAAADAPDEKVAP
jgi:hypothetical protein